MEAPAPVVVVGVIVQDGDERATLQRVLGRYSDNGQVGDRYQMVLVSAPPTGLEDGSISFPESGNVWSLLNPSSERASSAPNSALPEPLTETEKRVLRFLPTNLSSSEIARELYISVNTVKTHVRHLYAKLGAHRRREAVDRARSLGLLRSPLGA